MSLEEAALITFKLYVFRNQKPTEIRKFSLKTDDVSFEKMQENLLSIFPDLEDSNYTLLWKDQEQDFITLSTSNEFPTFKAYFMKMVDSNEEIKLFINFKDELFAASESFEQGRVSSSCNVCQKKLTLMCLDCSTCKQPPQEQKILNIADQASVSQQHSSENGDVKTPIVTTMSNGSNITCKTLPGQSMTSMLKTSSNSAPGVFPIPPPSSYQFNSMSKSSDKTPVFGMPFNNLK